MKEFKVEDLPGIGATRGKRLRESGITTPYDILIRGAQELSVLTEMNRDACSRLVDTVKEELRKEGLIPKPDMASLLEYKKKIIRLPTGSKILDEMLGGVGKSSGGLESQAVTLIYGQEGAGKTQVSLTLAAETLNSGDSVIFIDCEGTFDEERFAEICNARGYNPDMSKLILEYTPDTDSVMRAIDTHTEDIISNSIKLIIIDGALGLFRAEFNQGRGDLNARQNYMKPFFSHLKNMAYYLNIAVLVTNQVMGNPDPYGGDAIKPVGGYIAGHAPKYILMIKKNSKNKRTITFKKSNRHPMYDVVVYLTEAGIWDSEEYKNPELKAPKKEKKKDEDG